MWPNQRGNADLVTFSKEILYGKLYFLRSMFRRFAIFPYQSFSELWNLTVLVLIHRTKYLSWEKIYPSKEKSNKRKIMKHKIRSDKKCPFYKIYQKFGKLIKQYERNKTVWMRYLRRHNFLWESQLY